MKLLRVLLVMGLIVSLSACDLFERRSRIYEGGPKIEFFPLKRTVDETEAANAGGTLSTTVQIQLIGRQRSSDLQVSFTVADSSTAVAGTHYSLPSTSATIPANSSQTKVEVNVLDNSKNDGGTSHVLYLNLKDSGKVKAADNLKTHTLVIRGADE